MKILVLNGSPKGKTSITLHTVLFLEKIHPEHHFTILQVGQKIKQYEKDFEEVIQACDWAELIVFAYPVYTFLAPYQLHRFIELMKEHRVCLQGKFATQISTSNHFYDVTAHKFIEENCYDFGMKYLHGLSAGTDDLLETKGQKQAESFFDELIFSIENNIYKIHLNPDVINNDAVYQAKFSEMPKTSGKDVVIVTNCAEDDKNLQNMIADFRTTSPYHTREINIRKFRFSGGCLGCLGCAISTKCVYKDGFDDFLRQEIQTADAIVYAFSIENHYTHSSFKLYDDRQFCNGHRTVTTGMAIGYLISGNYRSEANLQMILEARSKVGGNYLSNIATDEDDTALAITRLSRSLSYALENSPSRPPNFYGVGGAKVFRDLIYLMQGIMKADHKYYKRHGLYDFPQKKKLIILKTQFLGMLMSMPWMRRKVQGRINDFIISPYRKVIETAVPVKEHPKGVG